MAASAFGDDVRRPARMWAAAASRAACEATFISSECVAPKIGGKRSSTSAIGSGIDMCTSYRYADACSSVRLTVVFSDDLINAIDRVAEADRSSRAEVLRKALQLYLVAHDGTRRGLALALVEPMTNTVHTEFVGL